jgi:Icc-related predicted phosphoesterase
VAGNHDLFGKSPSVPDFREFLRTPGVCFLDTTVSECEGLRIGGVSGIIGNPRRPFRKREHAYLESVEMVLERSPDLLILHDGPDYRSFDLEGIHSLRTLLEARSPILVVRGHKRWSVPLVELDNGTQVLNVDSRVVILSGPNKDLGAAN